MCNILIKHNYTLPSVCVLIVCSSTSSLAVTGADYKNNLHNEREPDEDNNDDMSDDEDDDDHDDDAPTVEDIVPPVKVMSAAKVKVVKSDMGKVKGTSG